MSFLSDFDPDIAKAIQSETDRENFTLEMIASENFVTPAVMEALGSVMTNKYAEGYPSKRYYGGCEYVDIAEELAINRAKELFGAGYANVQPHSGSQQSAPAPHHPANHNCAYTTHSPDNYAPKPRQSASLHSPAPTSNTPPPNDVKPPPYA
mgnify:CR=1 FL=1